MTTSGLFRLSGTALVLAAALFAVAEVISFYILAEHGAGYDLREIALTGAFFLQSLLTLFAGTLLLGGMVGLYARQVEAAGKLGLVSFVLAFFVTAFVVGDFFANTFVTPLVAREAPAFLDNPLSGFLQVWLPFDFVLLAFGWSLLAVATLRARVYPRGTSWALLVTVLLALVPFPLAHLPFSASLAWAGLHLRRVRDVAPRGRHGSKPRR
jgi:hypothetical protein